jgi:hypothetical protein
MTTNTTTKKTESRHDWTIWKALPAGSWFALRTTDPKPKVPVNGSLEIRAKLYGATASQADACIEALS